MKIKIRHLTVTCQCGNEYNTIRNAKRRQLDKTHWAIFCACPKCKTEGFGHFDSNYLKSLRDDPNNNMDNKKFEKKYKKKFKTLQESEKLKKLYNDTKAIPSNN